MHIIYIIVNINIYHKNDTFNMNIIFNAIKEMYRSLNVVRTVFKKFNILITIVDGIHFCLINHALYCSY